MKDKLTVFTVAVLVSGAAAVYAQTGASGTSPSGTSAITSSPSSSSNPTNTTNTIGGGTTNTNTVGSTPSNQTIGQPGATGFGSSRLATPSNMNSSQFDQLVTSRWDTNGDGVVSRSEWNRAIPGWFGSSNTNVGAFGSWDRNNNGLLDSGELSPFFGNSRLYQLYDTNGDGVIDETEAARIPLR
jgi:hypothetical protein